MAAAATAVPIAQIPPLPSTKRGSGIHINATKAGDRMIYASGNVVVIRSVADPSQVSVFGGHRTRVTVAKFSPNGQWVASGDDKGRVFVWGTNNQVVKKEHPVCQCVTDLDWTEDGKRIVAVGHGGAGRFGRAFMWDSGSNVGDLTNHSKTVLSCSVRQVRPYKAATCGEDMSVVFSAGPPFKFEKSDKKHTNFVNCVRYSPDGSLVASASADRTIRVYDGKTGEHKVTLGESKEQQHGGSVYSIAWAPDSKQILSASGDKTCRLWDVESGKTVTTFTFPNSMDYFQVAVCYAGDQPLSVSLNGYIHYLDAANPDKPKRTIEGHQGRVSGLAVPPSGDDDAKSFVTCDANGRVVRYDMEGLVGKTFAGAGHGAKGIVGIGATAGGKAVTAGKDDTIRFNDMKEAKFDDAGQSNGGFPSYLATAGGKSEATVAGCTKGHITVFKDGRQVARVANNDTTPRVVAISPDESTVVAIGDNKKVYIYSHSDGALKLEHTGEKHKGKPLSATFSPCSGYVAVSDSNRGIFVWDVKTGKPANPIGWRYHTAAVNSVAWAPDGKLVASGGSDQHIFIWRDVDEFDDKRHQLEWTHTGGVEHVAWLGPKTLISSGVDNVVKVWKIEV